MNQNTGQQRQFTPIGGGDQALNPRWEPQKALNFNPSDPSNKLQGYFKDLIERISGQGSAFMVAEIVTVNSDGSLGVVVDVSGGKALTKQLDEIPLGTFIMIEYVGKERSKSSGFTYNNWKTYKDENAIPFQQLGGYLKQKAAPQQSIQQAPVWNQPAQQQSQGYQQQYIPPAPQNTFIAPAPMNTAPAVQQQAQNNQPPQFGGQPIVGNPFENNQPLPF